MERGDVYMNEAIKDLLTSQSEEDIRLGILIAKQEGVSAENVWREFSNTIYKRGTADWLLLSRAFDDYMELQQYPEWK